MAGLRLPFGTTGSRKASDKGESNMKTRKSGGEKGVTLIAAHTEVSGERHAANPPASGTQSEQERHCLQQIILGIQ